jgi:glucan 1,3-beta-glucosidase
MKISALLLSATTAVFAHPFSEDVFPKVDGLEQHLQARQACSGPVESNPTTWWRAAIGHNGTTPTSTDSSFQYYRTVVQYGADNTGTNDAAGAFNFAIEGI